MYSGFNAYDRFNTCRICGESDFASTMVRVSTRSFNHPKCFIKKAMGKGRFLSKPSKIQLLMYLTGHDKATVIAFLATGSKVK